MKNIPLSAFYRSKNSGIYVAIVDADAYDYLSQFHWNASLRLDSRGCSYVRARRTDRSSGRTVVIDMHRVVWERANGPVPEGLTVDHIEHGEFGALDNRLSNLRLATRKDQQGNRRKSRLATASRWKGVQFERRTGKWAAAIVIKGSGKSLGQFESEEAAARAYDSAALKHFGTFAKLNFPAVAA